jgi:hypothetical protein
VGGAPWSVPMVEGRGLCVHAQSSGGCFIGHEGGLSSRPRSWLGQHGKDDDAVVDVNVGGDKHAWWYT